MAAGNPDRGEPNESVRLHPGDSAEQRAAEGLVLELLSAQLGLRFSPGKRVMPDGTRVELDAISDEPPVLVEVWSHQGPPKSAQKHKVMTDALKLVWAEAVLFPESRARKILALADTKAAAHFIGSSWMSRALTHLGIEVMVLDLPEATRLAIREAQKRQFR